MFVCLFVFLSSGGLVKIKLNPFRTAVPSSWGRSTQTSSSLSSKRDCGSKRVKPTTLPRYRVVCQFNLKLPLQHQHKFLSREFRKKCLVCLVLTSKSPQNVIFTPVVGTTLQHSKTQSNTTIQRWVYVYIYVYIIYIYALLSRTTPSKAEKIKIPGRK